MLNLNKSIKKGINMIMSTPIRITSLVRGDKIRLDEDFSDIETFLGFTDDSSKYGESPKHVFANWREVKAFYNVTSMRALEALQDKNEYGMGTYIQTRDETDGTINSYYYIFEGAFVWGSSALRAKFLKITEVS